MCIVGESESGHGGRFEPCEECKRLQAKVEKHKSRREHFEDLLNRSIEHENEWMQRALKAEAENAALRQDRDRFAVIVEKADALAEVASCYPTSGEDSDMRRTAKAYQEARHAG